MTTAAEQRPVDPERSRRRWPWVLLGVAILGILLGIAVALLVRDALTARESLQRAQSLAGELRTSVIDAPDEAPELADDLVAATATARESTDGWLWRAAEGVPVLGRNLSVVRELAAEVDTVASDAIQPLVDAGTTDLLQALRPVDGAIDVAALAAISATLDDASGVVTAAAGTVRDIDASGTVGQVADARDTLAALLGEVAPQLESAAVAARLLPRMLGADGPRNYLLMFQNNAEARSLGGNPASMILLTADQGRLNIAGQASSTEFPRNGEPPVPIDPNLTAVYYPVWPRYIQDIGMRPDFPTMAQLGKGYWEQQFGEPVDTVVSFDPVALAGLLDATGPVPLPTGDQLTGDNAVQLLLYEVYARYREPAVQDTFFAAAAGAVFDALTSGAAEPVASITALTAAAEAGRLLVWSTRPEEQAVLSDAGLDGALPVGNDEATVVGVYFNDTSGSKIDFFVDSAVTASSECATGGSVTYSVTYTLSSRLSQEQADALPPYVASYLLPRGQFQTEVYLLGPVGSTFVDWTVDQPSLRNELLSQGTDLGRPLLRLYQLQGTGGPTMVTARFALPAGKYGPLEVRATPMVNPTSVEITDGCR